MKRLFLALALVAVLVNSGLAKKGGNGGGGGGGGSDPGYRITNLGGIDSFANDVSAADQDGAVLVVGDSKTAPGDLGERHAIRWTVSATGIVVMEDLVGAGGGYSRARALNDAGDIVGAMIPVSVPDIQAFVLPAGASGLLSLDDGANSFLAAEATDINNNRQIVGWSSAAAGVDNGAFWEVDGQGNVIAYVDLGDFWPNSINDLGVMAGWVDLGGSNVAAVAEFDVAGVLQVQLLGLLPGDDYGSVAFAINDFEEVVGESRALGPYAGFLKRAFLWSELDGLDDLGDLGGGQAAAAGVNNLGHIVGEALNNSYDWRAVIVKDGLMTDLNSVTDTGRSKWNLESARAVNDAGHVAGSGWLGGKRDSKRQAYLLTPTP